MCRIVKASHSRFLFKGRVVRKDHSHGKSREQNDQLARTADRRIPRTLRDREKRADSSAPNVDLTLKHFRCRNERSSTDPEPGIPLTLATQRAQAIESISYDLSFTIPAAPSDPVTGHAVIRFSTQDLTRPLVLDFSPGADYLKSISVGGKPSHFRVVRDHIII